MEQTCPCCDNHCPAEALGCPTGKEHFGVKDAPGKRPAAQPEGADAKLIVLLRKCGHFLHHNAPGGDSAPLVSGLDEQERQTLEALLEKCLANWQQL